MYSKLFAVALALSVASVCAQTPVKAAPTVAPARAPAKAPAGAPAKAPAGAPSIASQACKDITLGEFVGAAGNYTVLSDLLDITGLYDALNGTKFVAFAPTDAAFTNALRTLNTTADGLFNLDEGQTLASLLQFHVSLSNATVKSLQNASRTQLNTAAGPRLNVTSAPNGTLTVLAGDNNVTVLNSTRYAPYENTRCGVTILPVGEVLLPRGSVAALTAALRAPRAPARAPAKAPAKAPTAAPARAPAAATAGRKLFV